jgi:hypothetical protein
MFAAVAAEAEAAFDLRPGLEAFGRWLLGDDTADPR